MIDRRTLIKAGAASAVLALPARLAAAAPQGVDALLVDTGYGRPPETSARLFTFAGDVTQVWFSELDRRWRAPGFVLGGITGADTLFVLERLAWDRGRRVLAVHPLESASASAHARPPVSWIIAPVHASVLA